MEEKALEFVNKGAPWKRDVAWPIIALQAAVLLGIGIYILVDKEGASDIILQLIGLMLLVTSILTGFANFRRPESGLGFYDSFRSGVGATAGLIVVISWWSDYIEKEAQRSILGWGLIAYTALHLIGLIAVRGRGNIRLSTVVIAVMTLVIGIILVTGNDESSDSRMNTLAAILIVIGVALAGLAFYVYKKNENPAGATAA
jgi:uncharacterized membrane protein HdeD (DUF308 family)